MQPQLKVNHFTYERLSSDLDAEHALVAETHEGDKEQAEEDEERGTSGKQYLLLELFWTTAMRLRRQSVGGFVYIQHKESCCHKLMEATQGPWVSGTSSEDNDKKNSLFSHSSLKSIETFS